MSWTPMSKETPKENEQYLVTVEDKYGTRWVEEDSWTGEEWWSCDIEGYSRVIAWMPYLEPYRDGEEGKHDA